MPEELTLDLFYEDADRAFAEQSRDELQELVRRLAPHIDLQVELLPAVGVERNRFPFNGQTVDVPYHPASSSTRQSVLITSENIGAQGWGWSGSAVVSRAGLESKASRYGDPAEILIHEWLHTLCGLEINGRTVPFADDAERCGFVGLPGPDGEDTWHDWYRFALGG